MKNQLTITEFVNQFGTREACLEHLCSLKWSEGYTCRKCGHDHYVKGRTWYYRKCQKCHYDESCTSNTLFHKIKFPLEKAFLMLHLISTHKKGISTCELARQFGVKQTTAWFFKRKVQEAMTRTGSDLLGGLVEVDETLVGGKEEGKPGRSLGKKQIVQVAVETYTDKKGKARCKRAYGQVVDRHDAEALRAGLMSMAAMGARICTDQWSAYEKATKGYLHVAKPSNAGANFQLLHWHIFNLKNWLRGTHGHIDSKHAQKYIDEFHFNDYPQPLTSGTDLSLTA